MANDFVFRFSVVSRRLIALWSLLALSVAQTTRSATVPTNETVPQVVTPLSCAQANGTMPNWRDQTCKSYFRCRDYVLTELACEQGEKFSLRQSTCTPSDGVDCESQNEAVRITVRASALLYHFFNGRENSTEIELADNNATHLDDPTLEGGALPIMAANYVAGVLQGIRRPPASGRTKRQIWSEMGVPTSQIVSETIMVTLPAIICDRVLNDTAFLEMLINFILLRETRCPDAVSCGIPLIELWCEGEDDTVLHEGSTNDTTINADNNSSNAWQVDVGSRQTTEDANNGRFNYPLLDNNITGHTDIGRFDVVDNEAGVNGGQNSSGFVPQDNRGSPP